MASFLGLPGVRGDREEARLPLGQGLAGPQLGQVAAFQERIDGIGATPALGDGLNHGRGPDSDVAGSEDTGPARLEGHGVRGEPVLDGGHTVVARADPRQVRALPDCEQDAIALDHELGAGCRLGAAPAARVGGAGSHANELDPLDLVASIDQDASRAGLEYGRAALLESLVDLARGRHILHVAPIDERYLLRSLADRSPPAVHRGEPAADDHHPAPLVARVRQAQGGNSQILQAVDHTVGRLVGDVELVGVVAACGDDRGVEALVSQVVQAEVHAESLVAHQAGAEAPDRLVLGLQDLRLGQAVLGDAVAEHAAGLRVALEDGHVMAGDEQVVGCGHAGRAGTDDRHSLAGLGLGLEWQRRLDAPLLRHQDNVPSVAVAVSNCDRLVDLVAAAMVLARRWADPAQDRREGDGPLEDAGRLAELALGVGLEEARDVDVAGALVLAGRQAVGVVVAEDQLEVGAPQTADLLGLGPDHHSRLGDAGA